MSGHKAAYSKKKTFGKSSSLENNIKRHESGNIFFTLFGAVAVVGLLGAVVVSTIRGPLSTMVEVQNRAKAESEMSIASRLILMEAAQLANDGDCDADGFVEPLEWSDAAGAGPTGGGFLPTEVASARVDPWGTEYGYCGWDAGAVTNAIGCDVSGNTTNERQDGNANPTDESYTVIAVISAGPDQVFDTTCAGGATPSITKNGDDLLTEFTYAEARASSDGLWNLKSGDPSIAEIDKNLEVTGGATFSAGIDLTGSSAALQLGAASMLLPNDTSLATCNSANDGLVRINTAVDPDRMEICDDPTGWVSAGGSSVWIGGAGEDIYYNPTGTPQVGIGTNSPTEALEVDGNILASGDFTGVDLIASGNADITGTFNADGAATLGSTLNVTGAGDFASTLNADGAATLGSTLGVTGATTLSSTLDVTGAGDFASTLNSDGATTLGSTLDVTGAATLDSTLDVTGATDLGSTLDVTGATTLASTLDAQGAISNSTGDVIVSDDLDVSGDIEGTDIHATSDLVADEKVIVDGDQLGPPLSCDSDEKLEWNAGVGWSCETDLQGGSGGGVPALDDLVDVAITAPANQDCLTYDTVDSEWKNTPCDATGIFENATTVIRVKDSAGDYATDDFVFGSPQLADDGDATHDARFMFDKTKAAFRAGVVDGAQWDDGNIGDRSIALGMNNTASGYASTAIGYLNTSSANSSVAIGNNSIASADFSAAIGHSAQATAINSNAMGVNTIASGDNSIAMGREINISATGDGSMGIGLTTSSPATDPIISGAQSLGIFMGDQSGYNLSTANRMALIGGHFMIDDAGATGSQGCLRYDGTNSKLEYSNDCTTYIDFDDIGGASQVFEVTGGAGTELVRTVDGNAPFATSDFVFGSPQMDDDGDATHDNRMIFDKSKAAFRVGAASGTQWDNANVGTSSIGIGSDVIASGIGSIALGSSTTSSGLLSTSSGYQTIAAGDYSNVFGNQLNIAATGDGSAGFGLTTTSPATDPIISGAQSFALFMGNHSAVNFAAANTFGLFGGKMVIDPNVPATQLTARSVLDLGAATDSIVMPSGDTSARPGSPVNGMFRYNTDNGKFEAYQQNTWQDILTSASGNQTSLSSITAATATNAIDNLNFAQTWNWSTLSTQTAMLMNANALTSGKILDLASSSTAMTGTMAHVTLSGNNAANTGTLIKSTVSGASSAAVPLMATNAGTGLTARFNDDGTDTDSTPVVIDAAGALVVGSTTARAALDVNGGDIVVSGTYTGTGSAPVTGAGTRMFFDVSRTAFRVGSVNGTQWDTLGNSSVGIGYNTTASATGATAIGYGATVTGDYGIGLGGATVSGNSSIALGNATVTGASSLSTGSSTVSGDYSVAIGAGNVVSGNHGYALGRLVEVTGNGSGSLGLTTTVPTVNPKVSGSQSYGIFLGNHDSFDFTGSNTVGIFGGKLLIDPSTPSLQATARGVLDMGMASDAIVLPNGITAQRPGTPVAGMFRYNSTSTPQDTLEYYDNETSTWRTVAATGISVMAIDDLTDALKNTTDNNLFMAHEGGSAAANNIQNTGIGINALDSLTNSVGAGEGDYNTALGYNALTATTAGSSNTSIGTSTLAANTIGTDNVAVGHYALSTNVAGSRTVAIGPEAMRYANDNGSSFNTSSTAVGYQALRGSTTAANNTGTSNTAIGYSALKAATSGSDNTALGYNALTANTTGASNVALGFSALVANVDGSTNSAVGVGALRTNIAGSKSTAVGYNALRYANDNATAFDANNSAFGYQALRGSTTSADNTGINNTAIGNLALQDVTSGSGNTAVGVSAGNAGTAVTTGSNNTFIGYQAQSSGAAFTNSTALGHGAIITASNQMVFGDSSLNTSVFSGTGAVRVPNGTTAQRPLFVVPANGGGMMRYNTDYTPSDLIEYYDAETSSWQQLLHSGSPMNVALSSITAATATNTIDSLNFAQTWNWSTLSTQTAMLMNANALTSGKILDLASSSTAMTGTMAHVTLSGNNAANTGTLIKSTVSGASSLAVPIMATNAGSGLSFRVNDDGTDTDTTPVVVDAAGNVGVGLAAPGQKMSVAGRIETQGGMLFNQGSASTDNLIYLGSTSAGAVDASLGFFAAGIGSGNSTDGAYFLARGNTYSFSANQRGNMYFMAGNPTTPGSTEGLINFSTGAEVSRLIITNNGNISVGLPVSTTPNYFISLDGDTSNRTIGMERETTNTTAGRNLTVLAGGGDSGSTDVNGGNLNLSSGIATGDGYSSIVFQTVMPGQGAGTTDRSPVTSMTLASNALTLPTGPTTQQPGQAGMQASANGMIRYDTTVGKFQGYQAGVWQDILTSASGNQTYLSSLLAATATNTIDSLNFGQTWNWSTLSTQTAMLMNANALTSGKILDLASSSTAMTGTMAHVTLSGNNAANTGTLIKSTVSGASSAAVPLMVTNLGTGLTARFNDQTGDGDTTPVVIDASGNLAIGAATARAALDVNGGDIVVSGTYTGTATLPVTGAGTRMFFDVESASFRAGNVTGTEWDTPGNYSFAGGSGTVANGDYSTAFGHNSFAVGDFSFAAGEGASTFGEYAIALGAGSGAAANYSVALGREVSILGAGSMGIGLSTSSQATDPTVSGTQSLGIFLGDQSGAELAANDTIGLFGGNIVVDPNQPATQLAARGVLDVGASTGAIVLPRGTTVQQPGTPTGGMFRYNTTSTPSDTLEYYDSETAAWKTVAATGGTTTVALSDITAATTANSIDNGAYLQSWNWALTGATEDAFTFGETTAATNGTGTQSILKASTLATSTAVPFMVTNLGNGLTARFNDGTGDAETTPFIIDAAGNVAIGAETARAKLDVNEGDMLVTGTFTGTATLPVTGAGTRMFFDAESASFRVGGVTGTEWDTPGNYSFAGGLNTIANGDYSTAFGNNSYAVGDYSFAAGAGASTYGNYAISLGLGAGASADYSLALGREVAISGAGSMGIGLSTSSQTTDPIVSGTQSLGIYIGDQSGVDFAANDTMGVFGGNIVVDPNQPATQLAARGVLDVGASTGAIVLPRGTTVQQPGTPTGGMFRYNTTSTPSDTLEYYDSETAAWKTVAATGGTTTVALSDITAATATNTIDSLNFGQTWNWSTLSTQTAMLMNANALTSGKILDLASSSTAMTGTMAHVTLSGNNAANTGTLIKSTVSGASSAAVPLMVTNLGTGLTARFNDQTGDGDTTPVVIDASGNLAIGAATARAALDVNGGDIVVSGTYTGTPSAPMSGAGSRMFFDVASGAFRAGRIEDFGFGEDVIWDDVNIGTYSFAGGWNTRASGSVSTALGGYTVASGFASTALGNGSEATANNAVGMGYGALASGDSSLATGYLTIAEGDYSTAMGREVYVSSTGDGSMGLGLTSSAQATDPIVSGAESFGIFLGDHSGVDFTPARTMGVFGGNLVIDPNEPATQVTARGVLDVGASTGAIVLPRGTVAQQPGTPTGGMFRYNTDSTPSDTLEYYDAETAAWKTLAATGASTVALSSITAATTTNTIDSLNFAQTWNWSTLSTQTAMLMNANALTSGKVLDLASSSTAMTGTMAHVTLSGNNAANTGTLIKSTVSGASSVAVPLMATNLGAGLSFRVNDETGDADATPFVVDAAGKVGINVAAPTYLLSLDGDTADQTIGMERETTNATDGRSLTIRAGAADSGSSDLDGGTLVLSAGMPTGNGDGYISFMTQGFGNSGSSDNPTVEYHRLSKHGLSFDENSGNLTFNSIAGTGQYWHSNSAFVLEHDNSSDVLKITAAPAGVGGATITYTDALVVDSAATTNIAAAARFGGDITSASLGSSQNNYNPTGLSTASVIRLTASTAIDITGLQGGADGRVITLMNIGSNAITLKDDSGSSTAANRFALTSDLILAADQSTSLIYDSTSSRWRVTGNMGSAGAVSALDDLTDSETDYTTDYNMWLGSTAGASIASGGQYNLAIGQDAGNSITTGDGNIGVGYNTLTAVTSGSWNIAIGDHALDQVTNSDNIAIGSDALTELTTSDRNTAVGTSALATSATGDDNVAIGFDAGKGNANGDKSVIIGAYAQGTSTSNNDSVFIGYESGKNIGFGGGNVAVGFGSLRAVSNGDPNDNNTAIGYEAMDAITTGSNNIALGFQSADNLTTGSNNITIGYGVDAVSATGSSQLNIGDSIYGDIANDRIRIGGSGAVTTGPFIVAPPATESIAAAATITANACGSTKFIQSTGSVTTGTTNTFTAPTSAYAGCCMDVMNVDTADTITLDDNANFKTAGAADIALSPYDSIRVCSDGTYWYQSEDKSSTVATMAIDDLTDAETDYVTDHNMWIGMYAGEDIQAGGSYNVAVGEGAGMNITTGGRNVLMGAGAGAAITDGIGNIVLGFDALSGGNESSAIAIGTQSYAVSYSTAIGAYAVSGLGGISIGSSAGYGLTSGENSVNLGSHAGFNTSTGDSNVAVGYYALSTNTAKNENTAVGYSSMYYADSAASDVVSYNTALGAYSLQGSTTAGDNTGTSNTALGHSALKLVTSGSNNIAIGDRAADALSSGSSNIVIGSNLDPFSNTASSQLNIGGTIYGDMANDYVTIGGSNAPVSAFIVAPAATETIAAAGTITANSCGSTKRIQSTGNVTTGTTNTFTAPTSSYAGCCMDVLNVDTADTITLDDNTNFKTGGGADIALAPYDSVRVCTDGTYWYHVEDKVAAAGATPLSSITAATATNTIDSLNFAQTWNWSTLSTETAMLMNANALTSGKVLDLASSSTAMTGTMAHVTLSGNNAANTGTLIKSTVSGTFSLAVPLMATNLGAGLSFRVNDGTGDTDTTPFVVDASGKVGINVVAPTYLLSLDGDTANQTIGMERETTNLTDGRDLIIQAGGGDAGSADNAGGDLILSGGISTGGEGSRVSIYTATPNTGSSSSDHAPVETARFHNYGLQQAAGANLSFNADLWDNGQFAYWTTESAFYMAHDTGNDLLVMGGAPSGTAGNTFTPTNGLTIDTVGTVNLASAVRFGGDITSASLGSSQNNYNPTGLSTASVIRLTASTPVNITGLQGGADGRIITLMNVGSNVITLIDSSGSSTAANRFALTGDLALAADQGTALIYDSTSSRWRVFGGMGAGAGSVAALDDLSDAATEYTGSYNLYVGQGTGDGVNPDGGSYNFGFGYNTLNQNTTGSYNIAIGDNALDASTAPVSNIAIGSDAMGVNSVTTGYNIAIGGDALRNVSSGGYNTIVGQFAGSGIGAGDSNVGMGAYSLFSLNGANADANVALGYNAMYYNATGGYNVAVGYEALKGASGQSNSGNTALGNQALLAATTGSYNIAIGGGAGDNITTGSNNIIIGYDLNALTATGSYKLNIGDTIYGDLSTDYIGIGNNAPSVALDVTGDVEYTGTITDVSDIRLKTDINPLTNYGNLLERIEKIDTYSFRMKDDKDKTLEFGVMAQELEKIFPELVRTAPDEMGTKSVNYVGLIAPMIEATKELHAENKALKAEIAQIKDSNADVTASIQDLTKQVNLLNKAAGENINKASILPVNENWFVLLLGVLAGIGVCLIVQGNARKNR